MKNPSADALQETAALVQCAFEQRKLTRKSAEDTLKNLFLVAEVLADDGARREVLTYSLKVLRTVRVLEVDANDLAV
jgi:hypothetical protein